MKTNKTIEEVLKESEDLIKKIDTWIIDYKLKDEKIDNTIKKVLDNMIYYNNK